jgi:hypothetical protein
MTRAPIIKTRNTYVKTTYSRSSKRIPNITLYRSLPIANQMISTTIRYGLLIANCRIITAKQALKEIKLQTVTFEDETGEH